MARKPRQMAIYTFGANNPTNPGSQLQGGRMSAAIPKFKRKFLFLQGVNSPFFPALADKLTADGHRVFKINFNVGDRIYWGLRSAWSFRGALETLPDFLREKVLQHGITDILLFGDRRPIHLPAIAMARQRGLRLHVFEEGYFRPNWITLERDGVNANSHLPRNADWYRRVGAALPDYGEGKSFASSLGSRARYDMIYHSFNFWNPLFYPRYRTHRPLISAIEYLGWGRRFSMMSFYEARDRRTIAALTSGTQPYFLLPLQLDSDAQIRDHSPFNNMAEVIELVMTSFALCAPRDARLVIKNHPLDTGFVNFRHLIDQLAAQYDLRDRVDYLESGNLDALLTRTSGLVTVNSTVGLSSLTFDCPTMTLSKPIYHLPGLTFAGPIDEFWKSGTRPDAELFRCFRNTVIHTTQINGGFYSPAGIAMAVANSVPVLMADRSPLEMLR